jgi:subtilisin family serine protease
VNSDLVGKVVNIASRCAKFVHKTNNGVLASGIENPALWQQALNVSELIAQHYENREFGKAMREITALADAPTPAVFDPRPLAARRNTDGSITLTREGGTPLTLGDQHKLGSGGTTDAYAIPRPGGENYVIKITRGAFDGNLDLIRETAAIDDFGMQAMRSLQSDVVEVPGIVSRYRATGRDFEGMVVTVARRVDAPSFEQVMRAEGRFDMTPEEAIAFDRFMREMADNRYVWADNKGDNFAFVRGLDGELRVSPFDFGGTLKFQTPEAAHAFRAVLDNPTAVLAARIANPRDAMNAVKYELAAFDEMVDWKFMNDVMGTQFDTTLDFPYLPHSGLNYPTLRAQVAAADAARATPAPSVTPSPAMSAGPGPARFESPTLIRFFPRGGVPNWGRRLGIRSEDLPSFLNREPQPISGPLLHGYPGAPRMDRILSTAGSTPVIAVGRPGVALQLASRSPRLAFHIGANATHPQDREVVVIDSSTVIPPRQPDPVVEFTEPDHARFEQGVDPLYAGQQWALQRVGVPQMPAGALRRSVTVAVIDTGLAWAHPDFRRDSLWINAGEIPANYLDDDGNGYIDDVVGWNFVDDNNLPWDTDGHGTLVAGIIAAAADNDEGIRGVNPAVRIMPLRALDGEGRSRASLLSEAIVYAANNGADVINLSVGGAHLSRTEQLAIDYARGKGALLVVAAGNQGIDLDDYGPAGADGVLTVAATGRDDQRLALSNWGAKVAVSAPGEDVVGLRAPRTDLMLKFDVPGYQSGDNVVGDDLAYYRATGTSFAAPLVAGVASLLLAAHPDLGAADAGRMILQTAADIGTPGLDQLTGYGLLDAQAALAATPEFFVDARIASVSVVQRNRQPRLQVIGTSDADQLADAWLELGQGTDPTDWRRLALGNAPVRNAVIHELQPQDLAGARQWTLKLVVEHQNGTRREARFALNVQ